MQNMLANPRAGGRNYEPHYTSTGQPIVPDQAIEYLERYDCVQTASTSFNLASPLEFFRVPINRVGSGFALPKTIEITNQVNPNAFERHYTMNIDSILVSVYTPGAAGFGDATARMVKAFWEDSRMEFKVDDKVQVEGRLKTFGSGSSITGVADMNGVAPQTFLGMTPTIFGVKALDSAVYLSARRRFTCRIFTNANNTLLSTVLDTGQDIIVRVRLRGIGTRSVE